MIWNRKMSGMLVCTIQIISLCVKPNQTLIWWAWNDVTHILEGLFLTLIRPVDMPLLLTAAVNATLIPRLFKSSRFRMHSFAKYWWMFIDNSFNVVIKMTESCHTGLLLCTQLLRIQNSNPLDSLASSDTLSVWFWGKCVFWHLALIL